MLNDRWCEWVQLVEDGEEELALELASKEEKPLVALALSVARWDIRNRKDLSSYDALCMYYNRDSSDTCVGCPLWKVGQECWNHDSIFQRWHRMSKNYESSDSMAVRISKGLLESEMHEMLIHLYELEFKRIRGID